MILSSDPPPWWSTGLQSECLSAASSGFPLEVCGFFVLEACSGRASFWPLRARASTHSFRVDPQEVVRFAYEIMDRQWTVLGSFHSHPDGTPTFSKRDRLLMDWGAWHVLGCRLNGVWEVTFARRSSCTDATD